MMGNKTKHTNLIVVLVILISLLHKTRVGNQWQQYKLFDVLAGNMFQLSKICLRLATLQAIWNSAQFLEGSDFKILLCIWACSKPKYVKQIPCVFYINDAILMEHLWVLTLDAAKSV